MVDKLVMTDVRLLAYALVGIGICLGAASACGGNGRPGSLVSGGGETGQGGRLGPGGGAGDAGQTSGSSGNSGSSGEIDEGAAGDVGMPPTPFAVFPTVLQVDVGCGQTPTGTPLVIQNGGAQPLTISSASADADYVVKGTLPLTLDTGQAASLLVTAPAPKQGAALGEMSKGTLSFKTNEPGAPTRKITLNTTLFGGNLEFTDNDGVALAPATLTLAYSGASATCPDGVTYRVHNTGNLAFTLNGPIFPDHLAGTTAAGVSIEPDSYAELKVGPQSGADGACSGGGALSFTVTGGFCGSVPALSVVWPDAGQANCTCIAPTQ